MIIGFHKLMCHKCEKYRWHETLFALAKCVTCESQRTHENDPIEIEHFVG